MARFVCALALLPALAVAEDDGCAKGYVKPEGATECEACPAGKYDSYNACYAASNDRIDLRAKTRCW